MELDYVDLGSFLVLAEKVLHVPAERLGAMSRVLGGAESALNAPRASFAGEEQYPEFATKAAVLCSRLIKNHPLPDGNKRVAFLTMNEFIERNGFELSLDGGDEDELFDLLIGVAAGEVSEEELESWLSTRIQAIG